MWSFTAAVVFARVTCCAKDRVAHGVQSPLGRGLYYFLPRNPTPYSPASGRMSTAAVHSVSRPLFQRSRVYGQLTRAGRIQTPFKAISSLQRLQRPVKRARIQPAPREHVVSCHASRPIGSHRQNPHARQYEQQLRAARGRPTVLFLGGDAEVRYSDRGGTGRGMNRPSCLLDRWENLRSRGSASDYLAKPHNTAEGLLLQRNMNRISAVSSGGTGGTCASWSFRDKSGTWLQD